MLIANVILISILIVGLAIIFLVPLVPLWASLLVIYCGAGGLLLTNEL